MSEDRSQRGRAGAASGRYLLIHGSADRGTSSAVAGSVPGNVDQITFSTAVKLHRASESLGDGYDAILVSTLDSPSEAMTFLRDTGDSFPVACLAVCNGSGELEVEALDSGADDVLVHPFRAELFQARLDRVRRVRNRSWGSSKDENPVTHLIRFGVMELDSRSRMLSVRNTAVDLTPKEYGLLKFFMERPSACHSRDEILDTVWGIDFDTGTNMVDMYVYFVRRKLKKHGLTGILRTVRGSGYRFVPPDTE